MQQLKMTVAINKLEKMRGKIAVMDKDMVPLSTPIEKLKKKVELYDLHKLPQETIYWA